MAASVARKHPERSEHYLERIAAHQKLSLEGLILLHRLPTRTWFARDPVIPLRSCPEYFARPDPAFRTYRNEDKFDRTILEPRTSLRQTVATPLQIVYRLRMQRNSLSGTTPTKSHRVVVSGSYKRSVDELRRDYRALLDLGLDVVSPTSVDFTREVDGFVFTSQDEGQRPHEIELRHLHAIARSDFVWLHAPSGYVGQSGAFEIGYATAMGIPVFAREAPGDITLKEFVRIVEQPSAVLSSLPDSQTIASMPGIPRMSSGVFKPLGAMQSYYNEASARRGYDRESLKDAMILITEEIGELARAVRKNVDLPRHGEPIRKALGPELADVFLYVLHIANIAGLDFAQAVMQKELVNERRSAEER